MWVRMVNRTSLVGEAPIEASDNPRQHELDGRIGNGAVALRIDEHHPKNRAHMTVGHHTPRRQQQVSLGDVVRNRHLLIGASRLLAALQNRDEETNWRATVEANSELDVDGPPVVTL